MPRGRKPEGEHALSSSERQARYRARSSTVQPPIATHTPRRPRQRTRPQRWRDAVAELLALRGEYATWLGALPDALQETATAEALQTIVDLDLAMLADVDPPRGYGRD
jgi:hypothetical protein